MRIKFILSALAISVLLTISALAQTGRIEGDIKNDKGEPIVGAEVEILRTDIKGTYNVKSDKKGHYLHAGVPFVGTYTILVSAPGYRPDSASGVRPDRGAIDFKLFAGDGSKLTLDMVQKGQAAAKAGGAPQKQMSEAEIKKQQEEYEKKKKEIEDYKANFEGMKQHFEAGREMLAKNDYNGAVTEFREAEKMDADQNHVIPGSLAVALYNRGVTQINAGQRDAAKTDFADSAATAKRASELVKVAMNDPKQSANAAQMKKSLAQYTKSVADANGILAMKYGDAAAADASAAAYKEAADLQDDPAEKTKLLLKRANTLREAFKNDEAVAAYKDILTTDPDNIEALYSLGIAYANNEKTFQDSANTLQAFVDRAPDTDPRKAEAKAVIGELIKGNNIQQPKADKGAATRKKRP